jgi:hypothetical protein
MRRRLAWALFAVTCVLALADAVLVTLRHWPPISTGVLSDGFPLVTLASVAGACIGALVVSRYPGHRVGWLLVVGQCGTCFGVTVQEYARAALTGPLQAAPGGHLAVWLSLQSGAVFAVTLLALLFLIVPDGRLLSPRWRWAVLVTVTGLLMNWAAVATVRPSSLDANGTTEGSNPPVVTVLLIGGVLAVAAGLLLGNLSLFLRLRRARGDERTQLAWMASAAGCLATGTLLAVVLGLARLPDWVSVLPLMVAYAAVPILTGVAILRFRLYDIDIMISRAIVLALLTGLVAVGYVVVVVVTSRLVNAPAQATFWPSLLATAVIALGVQPARRRLTQLASRMVYGAQAAPYEALADFSRELSRGSLADLMPQVAEAVGRAVSARHVEISVDVPGRQRSRISWPDAGEVSPDLSLPVTDLGRVLGGVAVSMPPGRTVRPGEQKLLRDFATQLGSALRNLRMESEVARQVDELAVQADDLRASRRRLLAAQATGRERFRSAMDRDVLPHLLPLPEGLRALGSRAARGTPPSACELGPMVSAANDALAALRTLTRGVFPPQLEHRGLVAALASHLELAGRRGLLRTDGAVETARFGLTTESAAYFCAVELLRELDPPEEVSVFLQDGGLMLVVAGRPAPGVQASTGHVPDRVAALDGTLSASVIGDRALMRVWLPLPAGAPYLQDAVRVAYPLEEGAGA